MDNINDVELAQNFIEAQIKLENYAVPFVHGVTYSDCLRINNIETEKEIDGKKIQAHRIYGQWDTILIAIGEVTERVITVKTKSGKTKEKIIAKQPTNFINADSLTTKIYNDWALPKYSSAVTEEETQWLEIIIRFIVYRRIMENIYHKWVTTGKGFADPSVATRIADIYRFRYEMPYVARLINEKMLHHKDREAEGWEKQLSQDIIAGVFDLLRADRLRLLPPVDPKQLTEGEDDETAI